MSKRLSAIMRQTWREAAQRNLSPMERLAFYEACFDYEFYNNLPNETILGKSAALMFDMIKPELDDDKEKLERIRERNRQNGSLGGRPAGKKVPNPLGFYETQQNPDEPSGTQKTPIHNKTLQNITTHAADAANGAASGGGHFDINFFDAQLWPRLNPKGEFNNRHRKCVALWASMTDTKKEAIVKAVLQDAFAGKENPYFYLQDFAEPGPHYLTPAEKEAEWRAGKNVYMCKIAEGVWRPVSTTDFVQYGLDKRPYNVMPPNV